LGKRGVLLAAVAGVLMLSTSCTVGPNYVKPTATSSAVYKEMAGWKMAQSVAEVFRFYIH